MTLTGTVSDRSPQYIDPHRPRLCHWDSAIDRYLESANQKIFDAGRESCPSVLTSFSPLTSAYSCHADNWVPVDVTRLFAQ